MISKGEPERDIPYYPSNKNFSNKIDNLSSSIPIYDTYNKNFQRIHKEDYYKDIPEDENENIEEEEKKKEEVIKIYKESKFITKEPYIGFLNKCGQNTCYLNVIIHLLYNFTDVRNILLSLYKIKELENEGGEIEGEFCNIDPLLESIGQIISEYDEILFEKKQQKYRTNPEIIVLDTIDLRLKIGKNYGKKYTFNNIADPVEFLHDTLDILNRNYQEIIHENFYINLLEKNICNFCQNEISSNFDKDNFIYHIYIDEYLEILSKEKVNFINFGGNFFF